MNNAWTQNLAICGAALAWLGVSPAAGAADAAPLLTKYNCTACHTVDKKLVGPSYTGVWGQIPMPPNNVPDADLKTIVAWVLAQK